MNPSWSNISDPIFHWAAERPHLPALHEGHLTLTYGELAPLVGKAAVYLASLGIGAGDRVAISLTNSIDHFILTLGLLRLGATTMEVRYDVNAPSADLLANFSIRTIFLEPAVTPPAGVAAIRLDTGWRDLIARADGDHRHPGNGEDVFIINLTSGTTGVPKGSLSPQRRYFQRMAAWAEPFAESGVFSPQRPANFLLTASIGLSVFFRLALGHLFFGGAVVILPEFRNVIDLVKALASWDNALCYLPAEMCRFLLSCAPAEGFLLPNMRALIGGGGFLYRQEKLAILDRVTPHFYGTYGASGFGMLSVLRPAEMRERPDSVGRPPSGIEVQVAGADGEPLPAGMVGRLRSRGTEGAGLAGDERFRDGWYYPGDIGHRDEAGYIYLKGRPEDVIHRDGQELFAADIESVIALHSSVAEVAVVAVPRPFAPDELVALVVARQEGQHEALAAHCQARLPAGRWPERVFYAPSLPKTPAGKLDRNRVKDLVMNEIDRQARNPRWAVRP
jgi:acyl-coenzyme A synthetase/AMP-(fatty) acid ligase